MGPIGGESAKGYITALYILVKTCDIALSRRKCYEIRRLVIGIHDTKVSETLQMDADLTIDKPKML